MSRILVIDDDADIHLLLARALESAGHKVHGTTNPTEAIGLLENEPVDLMVLDVMMPRVSGFDLLAQLRRIQRWQSLPVLMLSAHSGTVNKVKGFRTGADDFLAKPFEIDELLARIERMLARRAAEAALLGTLKGFAIEELLQNLQVTAKTGVLYVCRDPAPATIEVVHGEVVQAEMGGLSGDDVLLALVGTEDGTFRFDPLTDDAIAEGAETLSIRSLLMEAAWLEDELAKREALLPDPERPLISVATEPPALPEDFESLPLQALFEQINSESGITTARLLATDIAAPLRIRLALALSIEVGAIRADANGSAPYPVPAPAPAPAPTRDEDPCRDIFSTLLTTLADRGCSTTPAYIVVFTERAAWHDLGAVVRSIPVDLLPVQRSRLLRQLDAAAGGALRLQNDQGVMVLSLRQLQQEGSVRKPSALLSSAAGVALWSGAEPWSDQLSTLLGEVDEALGCATGLVVGTALDTIANRVSDASRWRAAETPPSNFREFLSLFL